jgi:hypothetical protein
VVVLILLCKSVLFARLLPRDLIADGDERGDEDDAPCLGANSSRSNSFDQIYVFNLSLISSFVCAEVVD